MRRLIAVFAFAAMSAGCVTVPRIDASPEDVADRMAGDVVAYNQAYGRAIADQVLLNVMRARDRQPLYHLSMSGISEGSQIVRTSSLGLGSITIGAGGGTPWSEGSVSQSWATTTKPGYTLNPFSATGDAGGSNAFQFRPVQPDVFRHFWRTDWPRDILLFVMVDDIQVNNDRAENSAINLDGCQRDDGSILAAPRCNFVRRLVDVTALDSSLLFKPAVCPGFAPPQPQDPPPPGRRKADGAAANATPRPEPIFCSVVIDAPAVPAIAASAGQPAVAAIPATSYTLTLRSVDDMIYYVGSLLRGREADQTEASAQVFVRPGGVYPTDRDWREVRRTATLFHVEPAPRGREAGAYAAEVSYRGVRYVAGPANNISCRIQECGALGEEQLDSSSRVLSLLTQLMIISQTERAQLGPRPVVAED